MPMYGNIFNQTFIQQQVQQYNNNIQQNRNILNSARKLEDFLRSLDKIEPEYRNSASICFCTILWDYLQKRN